MKFLQLAMKDIMEFSKQVLLSLKACCLMTDCKMLK